MRIQALKFFIKNLRNIYKHIRRKILCSRPFVKEYILDIPCRRYSGFGQVPVVLMSIIKIMYKDKIWFYLFQETFYLGYKFLALYNFCIYVITKE